MNAEILHAGELFVALIALDDLLVYVATFVHRESPLRGQHRTAQIAQMPGTFVRQPVSLFQVPLQKRLPLEAFQANRARVPVSLPVVLRIRASVLRLQMIIQVLLVRIGLVAIIASIQLLSRVGVHVL